MFSKSSRSSCSFSPSIEPLEPRMLLSGNDPNPPIASCTPSFTVGEMQADPQRNIVYMLDHTDNMVVALDTDNGTVVASAGLTGNPDALAVSVDDSELYVTESSDNLIQVFSLPGLDFLRGLSVPSPLYLAAGAGGNIYVSAAEYSNCYGVRQIDGQTGRIINIFGNGTQQRPRPCGCADVRHQLRQRRRASHRSRDGRGTRSKAVG